MGSDIALREGQVWVERWFTPAMDRWHEDEEGERCREIVAIGPVKGHPEVGVWLFFCGGSGVKAMRPKSFLQWIRRSGAELDGTAEDAADGR